MIVKPMLAGWEIPRISGIAAQEERTFVEFAIPGRAGSLFQDLNAAPMCLSIEGSLQGDEVRNEFLESVREQFKAGEPVTFVADILTATEVQYVVIEQLTFEESAERPDELAYHIVVRESPPPPPPPDPLGGLDAGLLDQADGFLDTVTGALGAIDALGSVPDIGDPTTELSSALDGVSGAVSGLDEALGPLRILLGTDEP